MGLDSNISWTDHTWNIARGCTKVDADCKFCYMYRDSFNATRFDPMAVTRTKQAFTLPLRIKEPSRIFACSLTDVFHEAIDSYRSEFWDIIRKCPQHTFQILTKRPERIIDHLPEDWGDGWPNVWLGTSTGSNAGRERIVELSKIPAKVRFISFEPLHEKIDMVPLASKAVMGKFHWAIIGGESGNETGKYRYRPCNLMWMMDIVNVCQQFKVKVFVKQMGTYLAKEMKMSDRHGTNIEQFPPALRLREFPIIKK